MARILFATICLCSFPCMSRADFVMTAHEEDGTSVLVIAEYKLRFITTFSITDQGQNVAAEKKKLVVVALRSAKEIRRFTAKLQGKVVIVEVDGIQLGSPIILETIEGGIIDFGVDDKTFDLLKNKLVEACDDQ